MKILAVDDDPSLLELIPMILAEAGMTDVTVANSAENALSVISEQSEPFECFLLDIQMPGRSGIELCGDIRKLPGYSQTPIIMLTAMQEKVFIDDAFMAGATDYITKPFDFSEVSARLGMAKLLVKEQKKVRDLAAQASKSNEDTDANSKPDFNERFDLGGVKGLVSIQAFENYLNQLSRAGYQSSRFFAIHMQDALGIFERCTASEFDYALRHVADGISVSYQSGAVVMCYIGNGNFICSSNAAELYTTAQLEDAIQDILDDKNLTYDDGNPLDIEVAIGAAVQPLLSNVSQLEDLETLAVKRAMIRAGEKNSKPNLVNIKHVRI
ncbi:response regulator [Sedimentitalea todarodis]|uniref:Response regulator transcription factor n=1 Tax=Sedimentitalea todarodis TaxID=1631240 RepID=A0ABU3VH27_9RHOB|nr:response regulator transcription factor [Sedimentitalea todarodis]MDU9005492.1 response regulator transcription factor [Sedimentitalea todarodis]